MQKIPTFEIETIREFPEGITFLQINNEWEIEFAKNGDFKYSSNSFSHFFANQHDSKINSIFPSLDGHSVAVIYLDHKCVLYQIISSDNFNVFQFENVLDFEWVDNKYFLILDTSQQIFKCTINSKNPIYKIEGSKQILFVPPQILFVISDTGLYYCDITQDVISFKQLFSMAIYSLRPSGNFVYFSTDEGISRINLNSLDSNNNLMFLHHNSCFSKSETLPNKIIQILVVDNHFIICFKDFIESFSLDTLLLEAYLHLNDIIGIFQKDENVFCYTSNSLFHITFPRLNKKQIISNQLISLYKSENPTFRFVETIKILQQNPELDQILLPFLVEQYSKLPEENTTEMSPLLLFNLKSNNSIVSFEQLYKILLKNNKQSEIYRFVSAYNILEERISLQIFEECKLNLNQVLILIKKFGTENAPISKLIKKWPNLSLTLLTKDDNFSAIPFIIQNISQIDKENIERICAQFSFFGLYSNSLNNEIDNIKHFKNPFYIYEQLKTNENWEKAAFVAEYLGLEDEYKFCRSKLKSGNIKSKSLNKIDKNEQNEIFNNLINELQNSSNKSFGEISGFLKMAGAKLDNEMRNIVKNREETKLIQEIEQKKVIIHKINKNITKSDMCSACKNALGKGFVSVFSCGHVFHKICCNSLYSKIKNTQIDLGRDSEADGCPFCGMHSPIFVHIPIAPIMGEWSTELE